MHRVTISASTAIPDWNGDRLDLPYAVEVFTQTRRDAPAEASRLTPPGDPKLN